MSVYNIVRKHKVLEENLRSEEVLSLIFIYFSTFLIYAVYIFTTMLVVIFRGIHLTSGHICILGLV